MILGQLRAFLPLYFEDHGDRVKWYWHKLTDRLWNTGTQLDSVTEFYVNVYLQMIDSRHLCQSDFWSIVRGPAAAIETFLQKRALEHATKTKGQISVFFRDCFVCPKSCLPFLACKLEAQLGLIKLPMSESFSGWEPEFSKFYISWIGAFVIS